VTLRALLVGLLLAVAGCTGDEEQLTRPTPAPEPSAGGLTVLTQNLYLGASLPVEPPTSEAGIVTATSQAYGAMLGTEVPTRLGALADAIERDRPDLVGLQEVTRWTAQNSGPGESPPSFDFLAILRQELRERGLAYAVAAVSENAEIGPVPLFVPRAGCAAPLTGDDESGCVLTIDDRDVVLVSRETPRLRVIASGSGEYAAQESFVTPGGDTTTPARGWAFADVVYRGDRLRFVTTHLEVKAFAETQRTQARELLAGPADVPGRVVLAGDLNSAADPATTDTPTPTYADLLAGGFRDAWSVNGDDPGATCCRSSGLDDQDPGLSSRIDVVLARGALAPVAAQLVGDAPIQGVSEPPYWISDHAGVVAVLRMR
jgi:endonuclease/exonuclease/phosphatase family metal-dependent hydrolase